MPRAADADPLELRLPYAPHTPEPKQHAFHYLTDLGVLEALYGGAAGGGKSDTLLTDALRYVEVPGYAALLLRKTYADLALPGAIMDRSKAWLMGTDARWSEVDFRWTFPSGATLSFGYLKTSGDRYRYASAEFQFIGWDELTQFEEADYRYLFSRLRRPADLGDDNPLAHVPIRMRSASNPGGRGHAWVKRRLVKKLPDPEDPGDTVEKCRARIFIPAKLGDNPHVDQAGYRVSLAALPELERKRLEEGDWDADDGTLVYKPDGLDAALALGAELDELARRTKPPASEAELADYLPPPAGDIALGIDFGEHTAGVLVYPLEAGGLWVVAGTELVGLEPSASADRLLGLAEYLPEWPGRARHRGAQADPARLIAEARYDAAGVQSMRTFAKIARARHPTMKTEAVAFGAPMMTSGGKKGGYKVETLNYLRALVERAGEGKRTRILAISGDRAAELARQMGALAWKNRDLGQIDKGDDHGPDALIAAAAPIAQRHRDHGEQAKRKAEARARARRRPPTP